MKRQKFEDFIWSKSSIDYFKTIYLDNEEFFVPKGKYGSNAHYISDDALQHWACEIANCYDPYKNNLKQFKSDLLEKRGGQYSNGTLYSSSRFVAEIFRTEKNRKALLDILNIKDNVTNFKWTLEYRLKIDGLSRPAQMDLVIENGDYFIGIEAKMKEIYTSWSNDFPWAYKDGKHDYLSEFSNFLKIDNEPKIKGGRKYCHTEIEGYEQCNFYYKQQICHLIGIRQKKTKDNKPNKKYLFLNFVFDPSGIAKFNNTTLDAYVSQAIDLYKTNEDAISKLLQPHFEKAGIEYRRLLTQIDIVNNAHKL